MNFHDLTITDRITDRITSTFSSIGSAGYFASNISKTCFEIQQRWGAENSKPLLL